jgi:hypothetical protein
VQTAIARSDFGNKISVAEHSPWIRRNRDIADSGLAVFERCRLLAIPPGLLKYSKDRATVTERYLSQITYQNRNGGDGGQHSQANTVQLA